MDGFGLNARQLACRHLCDCVQKGFVVDSGVDGHAVHDNQVVLET